MVKLVEGSQFALGTTIYPLPIINYYYFQQQLTSIHAIYDVCIN